MEIVGNKKDMAVLSVSEFESKSITGLFWKYTIFALGGLAFQAVQVIMDGAFVGNGIGPYGLAVISVTTVFWQIAVALFNLFGIGGSTLAAIKLGNGDAKGAKEVYSSVLSFSLLSSVILGLLAFLDLDGLLAFIGATPDIMDGARSYVLVFLVGFPFCVVSSVCYFFTRVAEKPFAAAMAYCVPALLAIGLEYILIFKLNFGIGASSFAGEVCAGMGFLLIPYLNSKKTVFAIRLSDLKINFSVVLESLKIGFAIFIIPISAIFVTIIVNNLIISTGGNELHLAAFGITNAYIIYVLNIFTIGFVTGIQPIASYNYGAKLYGRVREIIRIGVVQSSIGIIVILAFVFIFAEQIIIFFIGPEPTLVPIVKQAMTIFISMYAFGNISQIASGYFMAVEKNRTAILNALARMVIFAIPLLYISSNLFGLKGVWMAQPAADIMAAILAIICLKMEYKRLGKMN